MATKFSLKDPNPGIWFSFDDNDTDAGRIKIRPLNSDALRAIRKAAIKREVEYKGSFRHEYEKQDDDLFSKLVWDYVIVEWERLADDDGKEIECTAENKSFLMLNNIGFATFIAEKRDAAEKAAAEIAEKSRKN